VVSSAILFISSSVSGGHLISKYNRVIRAQKKVVKFLKAKKENKYFKDRFVTHKEIDI
jgi:hypothetical protein